MHDTEVTLPASSHWQVYVIESSDGKLYTGITNDLDRRWHAHLSGKGAKFFRGRLPQKICYVEACPDRRCASKREIAIKKMSRQEKLALIKHYQSQAAPNTPAESPSSA